MCAIERHPDSSTRDSLTHTLFNLIKRPDEQQRRIIMDVGMINLSSDYETALQFVDVLNPCVFISGMCYPR